MHRFGFIATLIALSTFAAPILCLAQESDAETDYVPYESIVDELQKKQATPNNTSSARRGSLFSGGGDPFENVWIHAGAGFTQMTQMIELPNGVGYYNGARGVQASVGIDILGPNLAAEGAVRSFGEVDDSSTKVSLKEFDLKILFKTRPQPRLGLRIGGGLSARYMTVHSGLTTYDLTTPASVLTAGGDIYLTSSISMGMDVSARTAMITDSFDRQSYDGTVRIDTHF